MSLRIGDIKIADEIIDLRFQVIRVQLILDNILKNNRSSLKLPTQEEMNSINEKAIGDLRKAYPNMIPPDAKPVQKTE